MLQEGGGGRSSSLEGCIRRETLLEEVGHDYVMPVSFIYSSAMLQTVFKVLRLSQCITDLDAVCYFPQLPTKEGCSCVLLYPHTAL